MRARFSASAASDLDVAGISAQWWSPLPPALLRAAGSRRLGPLQVCAELDIPHEDGGSRWGSAVLAAARLDAGLLVGTDHIVVRAKGLPLPCPFVEIENTARLVGEVGVSGKDPAAMVPRADGVFGEPAPDGRLTNRSGQTTANDLSFDLGHAETGEGKPALAREFTGEGLYGDNGSGGKRHPAGPAVGVPPSRQSPARRSACATCSRSGGATSSATRIRHRIDGFGN